MVTSRAFCPNCNKNHNLDRTREIGRPREYDLPFNHEFNHEYDYTQNWTKRSSVTNYSQGRSSVPPKIPFVNWLFEK